LEGGGGFISNIRDMKKLIIRIALKMLKKEMKKNPDMTYAELGSYGVEDVVVIATGEKALII
jgi:hypothetical protein